MRTEARATRLVLRSEAGLDLRLPVTEVAPEPGSPRRLGSGLPLRVWEASRLEIHEPSLYGLSLRPELGLGLGLRLGLTLRLGPGLGLRLGLGLGLLLRLGLGLGLRLRLRLELGRWLRLGLGLGLRLRLRLELGLWLQLRLGLPTRGVPEPPALSSARVVSRLRRSPSSRRGLGRVRGRGLAASGWDR
eukprot:scaffold83137_cov45-Phaeocystis_antarctica.AAC.2